MLGSFRHETNTSVSSARPRRHGVGRGQPLTDPSPGTIPQICSPSPALAASCPPPFRFTQEPLFFFLLHVYLALLRTTTDITPDFTDTSCHHTFTTFATQTNHFTPSKIPHVTHPRVFGPSLPLFFFPFLFSNLIFSLHPTPRCSRLPPEHHTRTMFSFFRRGRLRMKQVRDRRDKGQRQASQRTQRITDTLPEVRVSRPVQNASIVFCEWQNTILKYYRH